MKPTEILAIFNTAVILWFVVFLMGYNFETHFWWDKPYLRSDYYFFHPHEDDTCDDLKFKYNLHHPNSTNPIKFENLESMIKEKCVPQVIVP